MKTYVRLHRRYLSNRHLCSHGFFWNTALGSNGKHIIEIDDNNSHYLDLTSNTVVNDGKWHHLAYTRPGSIVTIYTDGAFDIAGDSLGTTNITDVCHITAYSTTCAYIIERLLQAR